MSTTLDGLSLFDQDDLRITCDSLQRAAIERSVAGLDGVLSIDLGRRHRRVRQRGVLRAASVARMKARVDAISALIDGRTHTLVTDQGHAYANLRVDAFTTLDTEIAGAGIAVEYEIVYTQLRS